ncbi:MAG TPA: TetR/AcrR family transcriptional regulator [Clostridiales bacterium]|nr:TetR/AcrR family transcriptional regulator [Clostridiales bacterium]
MKNGTNVKEKIINVTTELIQQGSGNIADITTREIAQRANVGVGLINYHFQSKDNLITICVQRIIKQVVIGFSPDAKAYQGDKERLTDWAARVFGFLFENPAISRISILGDLFDYSMDSNSVRTQKGFGLAMKKEVGESDKRMLSFILTSAMQTAFLSSKASVELLGYDFNEPSDRKAFITRLVAVLFDGIQ